MSRSKSDPGHDGGLLHTLQRWLRRDSDGQSLETDGGTEAQRSAELSTDDGFGESSGRRLDEADPAEEPDLAPEECVLRGVREHDGRIRQQALIDYTGWSSSTVSRTLTRMEDDGLVVRYRLGREKVVCLPDATPDDRPDAGADGDEQSSERPEWERW